MSSGESFPDYRLSPEHPFMQDQDPDSFDVREDWPLGKLHRDTLPQDEGEN